MIAAVIDLLAATACFDLVYVFWALLVPRMKVLFTFTGGGVPFGVSPRATYGKTVYVKLPIDGVL